MYGAKIRMIRDLRGYSQESIATKLNITQASYSRIENNQIKIDVVLLEKLAKELSVAPADILSGEPAIINFTPNQVAKGNEIVEDFYAYQKGLVNKIIEAKDAEIMRLTKLIEILLAQK